MKVIARNIQRLRRTGVVENCKDSFNRVPHIGPYPAEVALLVEPFQSPMFEAPNHLSILYIVYCRLSILTVRLMLL